MTTLTKAILTVVKRNPNGLTVNQLTEKLTDPTKALFFFTDRQTISGRVNELYNAFKLGKNNTTRLNPTTKRQATVFGPRGVNGFV